MSIIGNVIREEMRLIQMLHIKLLLPHKRTRDIDHNEMFRADCAHYSLPAKPHARHYCVLEKTTTRRNTTVKCIERKIHLRRDSLGLYEIVRTHDTKIMCIYI